jgi:hypothetical protein
MSTKDRRNNFVRYGKASAYLHEEYGHPLVTTQTLREWRKKGIFPEPIQLSPGCKGYYTETLDAHAEQRPSE